MSGDNKKETSAQCNKEHIVWHTSFRKHARLVDVDCYSYCMNTDTEDKNSVSRDIPTEMEL
jgi:hypothetical protein